MDSLKAKISSLREQLVVAQSVLWTCRWLGMRGGMPVQGGRSRGPMESDIMS